MSVPIKAPLPTLPIPWGLNLGSDRLASHLPQSWTTLSATLLSGGLLCFVFFFLALVCWVPQLAWSLHWSFHLCLSAGLLCLAMCILRTKEHVFQTLLVPRSFLEFEQSSYHTDFNFHPVKMTHDLQKMEKHFCCCPKCSLVYIVSPRTARAAQRPVSANNLMLVRGRQMLNSNVRRDTFPEHTGNYVLQLANHNFIF